MILWTSRLFIGCFLLLTPNIEGLYPQNKTRGNPHGLPKGYELFVSDFRVPIHSSRSKDSSILKYISYGSRIRYDSEFLQEPNRHWLPIVDDTGIAGYVMRSQILEFPSQKRFQFISKDIESKLLRLDAYPNEREFYEIVDYLFWVVKEGEFLGSEYLFLKMRGGEALGILMRRVPEEKIALDFLKKYEVYLTRFGSKSLRMDENYFWKYASLNNKNAYGDISGQLAVDYTYRPDCKGEVACTLDWLNSGYLKYLSMFPSGKKASLYSRLAVETMDAFLKDMDQVRCFPPLPESDWRSLAMTEYRSNFLIGGYRPKMQSLLSRLRTECFPSLKSVADPL